MDTPELPPASTPSEAPPPQPGPAFEQIPSFAPPQYYGSPEITPPAPSRSFMDIWKIIWTQPDVAAYRDVLRDADTSLTRALMWVAGAWGVQLLIGIIFVAIFGLSSFNNTRTETQSGEFRGMEMNGGGLLCTLAICLPVLLLVGLILYLLFAVGIPHVVATMFGGTGTFEHTAFLYAAITAPSTLIGLLRSFVPHVLALQCIVGVAALLITFYVIYLQTIAIKSVHDLGWGASFVSAISPFLLILIFVCGCVALAAMGGAGSQMN